MIYRNYGTGYKNGIEHFLFLSDVTDNDIALLNCLGYEPYGALTIDECEVDYGIFTIDECEVETWVKYESKDLKTKLIKALLQTITYDEMTKEQKKLVTEYETEIWKAKINELVIAGKDVTEEQIHDWWLDYEFSDETEINLTDYIKKAKPVWDKLHKQ